MSCLHYQGNDLFIENMPLQQLAAEVGTPLYVYSLAKLTQKWSDFDHAFKAVPHRVCYAVKANSNLALLNILANLGSGFDIVSGGELARVIEAGGDPKKVVFSGVGKSIADIEYAIKQEIDCFNIESEAELDRVQEIAARLNKKVRITLRINPDVNPNTHAHISTGLKDNKFGIEFHKVIPLCQRLAAYTALELVGIGAHIGSQIVDLQPFLSMLDQLLVVYRQLQQLSIPIQYIDIGGGLGITYRHEKPPAFTDYANAVIRKLRDVPVTLLLEPGRTLIGNCGVLLTRVEYLKHTRGRNFAVVDAGMNDLMRPALYSAWHAILPVTIRAGEKRCYDIAGPVCESADFLGKDRDMVVEAGDLLAIDSAGAYGFSMSSNYNSRLRPAEVLVDSHQAQIIRHRETIETLYAGEVIYKKSNTKVIAS